MARIIRFQGQDYYVPATASSLPSVVLVGLPKSGTTLLTKVFRNACELIGVQHLDVHGELFVAGAGHDQSVHAQLREIFEPAGYCYGAFRQAFSFLEAAGELGLTTIWIRRDPKDVIVSRYFSDAYSHRAPGGGQRDDFLARREEVRAMGVDEFALSQIEPELAVTRRYLDTIPSNNLQVYWYEDLIYRKHAWIAQMMADCRWPLTAEHIDAIVERVDVVPVAEDPKQFIRQVHPGNHKKHLAPETIARIDRRFAEELPSWKRRRHRPGPGDARKRAAARCTMQSTEIPRSR